MMVTVIRTLVIATLATSISFAQSESSDLSSIFGKRITGKCASELKSQLAKYPEKCEIYEYKKDFIVQVIRDENLIVSELQLRRVEGAKTVLSPTDDSSSFLSFANRVRTIGSRRAVGNATLYTMERNNYWDLYDGAIVRRFYEFSEADDKSHLYGIAVIFPSKIKGTIDKTKRFQVGFDPEAFILQIFIGRCSYLALDKSLKTGSTGTFEVVGPQNEIDGKCIEMKVNWDDMFQSSSDNKPLGLEPHGSQDTRQKRFAQYPTVLAYEVKPGVLMIPRYTANSEICEFGLEALQYSPDLIRVSSELSGEQIFQLLDELIPGSDRGKPLKKSDTQISQRGRSVVITTTSDYENVVIRVYAAQSADQNGIGERMDGIVVTVKWKQRQCRP